VGLGRVGRSVAVLRGAVAAGVVGVVAFAAPGAGAAVAQQLPPSLVELGPPTVVDNTNRAGWWTPIVEHGGATYYAYDIPGSTARTHVVRVVKRLASGRTESSCLSLSGAGGPCHEYRDDVGHHQPSIAVDGDGYVHVFTAMHSSPFAQHYFRSAVPESVTTFADRGVTMPDPTWTHTYPVLARAPGGDLWLAIRSRSSARAAGVGGRLYHYDRALQRWSRATTFAYNPGLWVYPDDLQIDATGRLHIVFEWVKKYTNAFPHIGAYATYDPATGRLANAAGQTLTGPLTVNSAAVYQSWSSSYDPTATYNGLGVQTAKLALDPVTGRPQIVYRYTPRYGLHLAVLHVGWDGTGWRRTTVYGGKYDTFPAVDVTVQGSSLRAYYVKVNTSGGPSTFVAERTPSGTYVERSIAPAHPRIERLSAITRADGTDVLYLSAPQALAPLAGELYLGTLAR